MRTLNQRNSFVAPIMMVDKKTQVRQSQIWEIITRDNPLPVYNGPMHDYQLDEGVARQAGKFPVSKIKLDQCAADCLKNILVNAPTGLLVSSDGNRQIRLAQMDARRQIATINLPEVLDLAQGVVFSTGDSAQHGAVYLAAPVPGMPKINLINMSVKPVKWKVNKSIETDGRIFVLKSAPASDLLWAGVQSAAGDYNVLQFIDKKTLKTVKTIQLTESGSGWQLANLLSTRSATHILALIEKGKKRSAILYDLGALKEVARLDL